MGQAFDPKLEHQKYEVCVLGVNEDQKGRLRSAQHQGHQLASVELLWEEKYLLPTPCLPHLELRWP